MASASPVARISFMTSTSLPKQTKILVVGSGPAGLATSLSLVKHGIRPQDIVVVDRGAPAEHSSKAIMIHAATLEVLDAVGCADDLVSRGMKGTKFQLQDPDGTPVLPLEFSSLKPYTKYPFFLVVPQTVTEHVLAEYAARVGVKIHSPYTVVGMRDSDSGDGLEVSLESGDVIHAKFVVGADGSRSTIRQLTGIKFVDPDSGVELSDDSPVDVLQSIVADVSFTGAAPVSIQDGCLSGTLNDGALSVLVPFSETGSLYQTDQPVYRLIFLSKVAAPSHPPLEVLQKYVDNWVPSSPTAESNRLSHVYWSSRFRHRSASAVTFYKKVNNNGRVFLVGDAAHIHSPAGGQGMNLGIRDAISLGIILGERLDAHDFDETLESHAKERRERAVTTIGLTKRLLAGATSLASSWFAYYAIKILFRIPFLQGWSCGG